MNHKVSLCALQEEYDWILPFFIGQTNFEGFSGSTDILSPQETRWRDIYHFLHDRGLELRPRYRPGWISSRHGTPLQETDCEDGIMLVVSWFNA